MTGTGFADSRQPVPVETGQGLTVRYLDRWLYSRRDPSKNPALAAASVELRPETLVFCPSPLLGYGLGELLARLPERCAVLAVEADERLMALSLGAMRADVVSHPSLRYVRTASVSRLLELVDSLPSAPFRRVARLDLSGGSAVDPEFYASALSALDEYVSRWWKNRITLMRLGRNFARNLLTNIGLARRAVPFALPLGRAPFMAAAGPSLERALPLIARFRDRIFLVAVDTAARYLADSGFPPDAIVLVESQYWIDPAFHALAGSGIPVLADLTARTASLLRCGGALSFFLSEYAKSSLIDRLASSGSPPLTIPPLGSVGLAALRLLDGLRAPGMPVFFAGLDFSWNGGYTHVRAAPSALAALAEGNRLFPASGSGVPGAGAAAPVNAAAGTVTSDPLLADYAAQARALAARVAGSGRGPVFDAGRVGLDTGFQAIDGDSMAAVLESALIPGNFPPTRETPNPSDCLSGADMGKFLNDEDGTLRRLDGLIGRWLDGERSGDLEDALKRGMAEADYLWAHFPDAARGFTLEADFLARARAGIGYFRKSIARALSFLSS